ncbi:Uncharacterized protein TCAP_02347 [Tolypocladium capitatum]|uniref:Uncharacterized protein n=1 Tax=Tolypocladium capitatum TaxID=45235 RepID=A0A2K3QJN0_9HYPO|nr:Uncharacterized protein TCAP_02347 [Tolypocladium capitatum]
MSSDVADQPDPRRHLGVSNSAFYPLRICQAGLHRAPEDLHIRLRQLILKLIPQHRSHGAAPRIPPTVPAYQHQHVAHVAHAQEQALVGFLARQPVAVDRGQPVVRRVQLLGEQEAFRQGLHTVKGHARQEGHVFEARDEVRRRALDICPGRYGARERRVEDRDVVERLPPISH